MDILHYNDEVCGRSTTHICVIIISVKLENAEKLLFWNEMKLKKNCFYNFNHKVRTSRFVVGLIKKYYLYISNESVNELNETFHF